MSLVKRTLELEETAVKFKKFISHEMATPEHLIPQKRIRIGVDNHLLVHNIIHYDKGLRIESDVIVYFHSKSIIDKIKSVINPNSLCLGNVRIFTLINKDWQLATKYNISKTPLRKINSEIDKYLRMSKFQDDTSRFYEEEYAY